MTYSSFDDITFFEDKTGHHFADRSLLRQVFVHRSYVNEANDDEEDNERLEFLGDAVLELVVSHHLFRLFPAYSEGDLTRLRSKLVQRNTLARVALRLRLDELLLLGNGEEESGGRKRPAILCAVYEALVGALVEEQGFAAAQAFVLDTLAEELNMAIEHKLDRDPKSRLQEYIQGLYNQTPRYATISVEGPDHDRRYIVSVTMGGKTIGVGRGHGKKRATQQAAAMALARLGQPAPEYTPNKRLEADFDLYDPAEAERD